MGHKQQQLRNLQDQNNHGKLNVCVQNAFRLEKRKKEYVD